jgi:asparagine synthase (glutamine-hydrolysing)
MLRYDSAGQDPAELERLVAQLEAANQVSQGILLSSDRSGGSAMIDKVLGFLPTMYTSVLARLKRLKPLFDAEYFAPFAGLDIASLLLNDLDVKRRLTGRAPVHQSMYLWSKTALPGYILVLLGDRMEMAHSVEGRVPFLDHEVGEFLFNMPVNMKIRGLTEKYVLREATRDVLTDTPYARQKHPFLSPPDAAGTPSRMKELIRDTLTSEAMASVPFLNARAVRDYADRLDTMAPAERGMADSEVMMLVSLILMQERLVQAQFG